MSADLIWQITRNNHAFLMRARGVRKTFSKEPNNLKNFNSPRLSGIANRTVVGVQSAAGGKGVVLTTSHPVGTRFIKKSTVRATLKKGSRPTYRTIRGIVKNKGLSRKLKSLAVRRASALLASQRVKPAEKKAEKPKK